MNFKQTVLQEGMHIFQQHGIKSLSVNTLLTYLNISKGTLSGIAATKEEFLELCITEMLAQRQVQIAAVLEQQNNPLEALVQLLKLHLAILAGHHADFLPDLKHYSACWAKVSEFSEKHLRSYFVELLTRSQQTGLLRTEFDVSVISSLLLAQSTAVAEAGLLHDFSAGFDTIFNHSLGVYLRGLVTEDGLDFLHDEVYFQEINQTSLN